MYCVVRHQARLARELDGMSRPGRQSEEPGKQYYSVRYQQATSSGKVQGAQAAWPGERMAESPGQQGISGKGNQVLYQVRPFLPCTQIRRMCTSYFACIHHPCSRLLSRSYLTLFGPSYQFFRAVLLSDTMLGCRPQRTCKLQGA